MKTKTIRLLQFSAINIFAFGFGLVAYAGIDGLDFPVGWPNAEGYYIYLDGGEWLDWTGTVFHPAEDWNGNGGGDTDLDDPVYAAVDGTVVAAGAYGAGWGNIVVIEHTVGTETIWTQYAHLLDVDVSVTDDVDRGDVIGSIGKGHNNEYAAHLHFEVRHEDLDPDAWVTGMDEEDIEELYYEPSLFINNNRAPIFAQSDASVESTTRSAHYQYLGPGFSDTIDSITVKIRDYYNGSGDTYSLTMTCTINANPGNSCGAWWNGVPPLSQQVTANNQPTGPTGNYSVTPYETEITFEFDDLPLIPSKYYLFNVSCGSCIVMGSPNDYTENNPENPNLPVPGGSSQEHYFILNR